MLNIAVMVSGGGTNLQAIIDGIESGFIENARIALVISSKSGVFSLERAEKHGIPSKVIGKENFSVMAERTDALIEALTEAGADLIVLAGYMSILEAKLIKTYEGRIINIHPSLIPAFCGAGYYGRKVHEAVLAAGEENSGATVHFVDEGVDTGPIILQEAVPVLSGDTADMLAARVLNTEHKILQEAVKHLVVSMQNNRGGQ